MTDEDADDIEEETAPLELDGSLVTGGSNTTPASNLTPAALTHDAELATAKQRRGLTYSLLGLVALFGAVMFFAAFEVSAERWDHFERAGTLILVPLLTLLGTAVGWYYRGERHK
jgi:hypothetical protein